MIARIGIARSRIATSDRGARSSAARTIALAVSYAPTFKNTEDREEQAG